jgi:DNA-directed RNA polymerase specialized sigma subunit
MDENVKSKDQELYEKWKATGEKRDLGNLVDQLNPLIYSEVKRVSGSLPNQALSAETKKWAIKAIQTYDPSKGTMLSTHVKNYLPKVRRMNYKYQNMVRLPENLQLRYHDYSSAIANLTDRLNRDPNEDELAKELGWSKGAVVKYKGSLYADLTESGSMKATETSRFNSDKIFLDYLRTQLSPEEKMILDNSKGISSSELASKLGVNVNRLNYLKAKLVKKIQDMKAQTVGFS